MAVAGKSEIELAMASAQRAATIMGKMPTHQRTKILFAIAAQITNNRESNSPTDRAGSGKADSGCGMEVDRAANTFQVAGEEARRIHGETLALDASPHGEGYFGFWWRRPWESLEQYSFQLPLNLVAHKLAPAIASGNAFVSSPQSKHH